MNIIITAPKHQGKSTLIKKILPRLSGSVSGFITEFDDRSSDQRALYIRSIDNAYRAAAVKWSSGGFYEIFFDTFDCFAASLIDAESDFVVIDELGKFEKGCDNLKLQVEKVFDSPCNVIASIRYDAAGWMQELKKRCDVELIELNEENRDSLPDQIMHMLCGR